MPGDGLLENLQGCRYGGWVGRCQWELRGRRQRIVRVMSAASHAVDSWFYPWHGMVLQAKVAWRITLHESGEGISLF